MNQQNNTMNNTTTAVEAAAMEAALADGLIAANGLYVNDEKAKKAGLRRGKWTSEEELYANRLIYEFKLGLLPLTDGTTLRTFLSKLLNCDPMRISKKFVGQNCIGKQVFRRRQQDLEKLTTEQIETSRRELAELERRFLERVAQTNRAKTTTSNGSSGKESRLDYEDEGGNPVLPPWMVPPAHPMDSQQQQQQQPPGTMSNSSSAGKGQSHPHSTLFVSYEGGTMSSGRYLQQQQQPAQQAQDFHATFPAFQQQMQRYSNGSTGSQGQGQGERESSGSNSNHMHFHDLNRGARGDEGSLPRVTSLDVLNTIAQLNSPSGSVENLASLGSSSSGNAGALKQQQLAFQQQQQSGGRPTHSLSHGADPTLDVFPGLARRANSSTLTLGDSVGWGSFSNFNSLGAGGSMDDLLAAGLYGASSASMDGMTNVGQGQGQSGPKYQIKASALSAEEGAVGYPLDDPTGAGSSALNLAPGEKAQHQRVKAPVVDVAGLSSSANASFYHSQSRSNNATGQGSANSDARHGGSNGQHGAGHGNGSHSGASVPVSAVRSDSLRSSNGSVPGLPKNGSVDDFWMLVNMGDLPQPENDVLSQTVWSPLERGISTGSIGGASLPGGVKQQEYTTVTSTPSMPPSSSRTVGPEGGGDAPSQSSNRTSSKRTEEVAAVVGGEDAHNSKRAKF